MKDFISIEMYKFTKFQALILVILPTCKHVGVWYNDSVNIRTNKHSYTIYESLAQLDRVFASDAKGHRFESDMIRLQRGFW